METNKTFINGKKDYCNAYHCIYVANRCQSMQIECLRKCYDLFVWKRCNMSDIIDKLGTVDFIKTCLDKMSNFDVVLCSSINRCDELQAPIGDNGNKNDQY